MLLPSGLRSARKHCESLAWWPAAGCEVGCKQRLKSPRVNKILEQQDISMAQQPRWQETQDSAPGSFFAAPGASSPVSTPPLTAMVSSCASSYCGTGRKLLCSIILEALDLPIALSSRKCSRPGSFLAGAPGASSPGSRVAIVAAVHTHKAFGTPACTGRVLTIRWVHCFLAAGWLARCLTGNPILNPRSAGRPNEADPAAAASASFQQLHLRLYSDIAKSNDALTHVQDPAKARGTTNKAHWSYNVSIMCG